jgi:phage/plasmid-like protein (TIGR03299 family)
MGQFLGDFEAGRAGFAFTGDRGSLWHRVGTQMQPGMTREEWRKASGNDFEVVASPAYYYDHTNTLRQADDLRFITRRDNGRLLGRASVTDRYVPCQPEELDNFMWQYIEADERFAMDVQGNFGGGSTIWAAAVWNEGVEIAGDKHIARLFMSTSFDGSSSTRVDMRITRPVCDNTIAAGQGENRGAIITTRHNTKFDPKRAGEELAKLAQGVAQYKKIGDAMARVHMSSEEVKNFFRDILDIPHTAKEDDVSTRKLNQARALRNAFSTSRRERNASNGDPIDVWTVLQSLTRYVDHDRVSINGDNGEKQFVSANFGSGDALKSKAMGLLLPRVRELIAA